MKCEQVMNKGIGALRLRVSSQSFAPRLHHPLEHGFRNVQIRCSKPPAHRAITGWDCVQYIQQRSLPLQRIARSGSRTYVPHLDAPALTQYKYRGSRLEPFTVLWITRSKIRDVLIAAQDCHIRCLKKTRHVDVYSVMLYQSY